MNFWKRIVLFTIFAISIQPIPAYNSSNIQQTQSKFDKAKFAATLKQMELMEFVKNFTQEYKLDSVKGAESIKFIKRNLLTSNDREKQFWGYYSLAQWENDALNRKAAIQNIDRAYQIAKKLNDTYLETTALTNKGIFQYNFGAYEESMEEYLKALELTKKTKDTIRQLTLSQNIALLKLEVNDNRGAIQLLQEALTIIKKGKGESYRTTEISIYIALTKAYIGVEDFENAKKYCKKGIYYSEQYNDEDAKAYLYNFKAEIAMADEKYDEALQILNIAEEKANVIESAKSQLPFITLGKGKVYYLQKDYEKAITILSELEKSQQNATVDFISLEEMYALLAKSYKETGDLDKSLYYYEKADEVYRKNDKRQKNISADIIKKYDLRTLKEELDTTQESSLRIRNILYISIVLACVIVIGVIAFYRKREYDNKQKFEKLLKSLEEEKAEEEKMQEQQSENVTAVKNLPQDENENIVNTPTKEVEIIDETKVRLLKKLQDFETKQLFLENNSTLSDVAKKLKTNTSYLSKIINAHKEKSFTAYITDLRINYAVKRLKNDKKFRSYTIDSIAKEVGFNRSESFSRAFKVKTGLYPSYFIKKLDNQDVK